MLERMIMRISYKRLLNYLTENLGYSEPRAKRTISALRKTDPRILGAFLRWFYTANLPREPLFGLNIKALCDRRSLDPVAAFLTADWAAREPKAAKEALSSGHDRLIFSKEDAGDIEEIMNNHGWKFNEINQEPVEDESDLTVEEKRTDTGSRDFIDK